MQEAESAFLYGMNGSQPTQSGAYQQQTASYAPTDAYGQPTAGYAPTDAYGQPTAGYAPTDAYSQPTNEEPTVEPDVSADAYAEEDDDEANSITNARAEGADRPIDDSYFPDPSEDEEEDEPETPAASVEYDDGDALVTADQAEKLKQGQEAE